MTFQPWIGGNFEEGIAGKRVMAVGESYYREKGWTDDPSTYEDATAIAVRKYMEGWKQPTFDSFTQIIEDPFTGTRPSPDTRREIWDSLIYFNFIQDGFRNGPSDSSPIPNGWLKKGKRNLIEMLDKYDPEVTVMFSYQIWKHYAPWKGNSYSDEYTEYILEKSTVSTFFLNDTSGKQHLVVGIYHPSVLRSKESRKEIHDFIYSLISR